MLSPALQGLVTNVTAEIADAQAIIQGVNDLSAANDSLTSQLSAAQAQVVSLQQQLAAVNLDDASAQAQVLALMQQLQAAQVQVTTLQAQIAIMQAAAQGMFSAQDVLTGKATVTVFAALQTHKRSPQVAGTTVNQDQEIQLQWGDPGGTKADSNPNTVVKPHGTAVWVPGTATTPGHLAFNPAAVGDNEYLFMDLPTPATPPNLFYSTRTYQCTAAEFAALICPESDSQFIWAGWIYNMGTQSNAAGWRFYQYGAPGHWNLIEPVIPVPDFVSAPMKFETLSTIDTVAHTVTRVAIRVNGGPWIPVNMVMQAYNTGGTTNKYTCAIQVDPKSTTPTGMSVLDAEERYLTVAA